MKDQTDCITGKTIKMSKEVQNQNFSQRDPFKFHDDANNADSDKDSGFSNDDEIKSSDFIDLANTTEQQSNYTEILVSQLKLFLNLSQQNDKELTRIVSAILEEFDRIPEEEQQIWMTKTLEQVFNENIPKSLLEITTARFFEGDSGAELEDKPEWLDLEKFYRGQKFARDHLASIAYADMISLYALYSFNYDLKPIIASGNSSTPYTSFKRYLSTNVRVHNWYKSDPWTPGTAAYKDIKAVRNMHALVRRKTASMSAEEYAEKSRIIEPWCPALDLTRKDFQLSCPVPQAGQCPFSFINKYQSIKGRYLSQGEMVATQFGFVGLTILRPEFFGIHYATEDDLEDFLHLWRGIGYLLGIKDEFNFCRGTLKDVKGRCSDFLEYWVKPNFRTITPEWEHMMRCVTAGIRYYYPGATYENGLLDLAEIMNLRMPRLYKTLTFSQWIGRLIIRFYMRFGLRFDRLRRRFNYFLEKKIERALKFDEEKHEELQKRSEETLRRNKKESQESEFAGEKPHLE